MKHFKRNQICQNLKQKTVKQKSDRGMQWKRWDTHVWPSTCRQLDPVCRRGNKRSKNSPEWFLQQPAGVRLQPKQCQAFYSIKLLGLAPPPTVRHRLYVDAKNTQLVRNPIPVFEMGLDTRMSNLLCVKMRNPWKLWIQCQKNEQYTLKKTWMSHQISNFCTWSKSVSKEKLWTCCTFLTVVKHKHRR